MFLIALPLLYATRADKISEHDAKKQNISVSFLSFFLFFTIEKKYLIHGTVLSRGRVPWVKDEYRYLSRRCAQRSEKLQSITWVYSNFSGTRIRLRVRHSYMVPFGAAVVPYVYEIVTIVGEHEQTVRAHTLRTAVVCYDQCRRVSVTTRRALDQIRKICDTPVWNAH